MNLRGPKVRIARQLGIPLTPKATRIMERRPEPPGQHGATPRRKVSEYKKQLVEKQRLRAQYNVSERQLQNAFAEATRREGHTGVALLQLLEMRVDNILYRANIAPSRSAARQIVRHGHVTVNGKKASIPSYVTRPGDVVALREKSKDLAPVTGTMERRKGMSVPEWLQLDAPSRSARVLQAPSREAIAIPVTEQLIVELYSK